MYASSGTRLLTTLKSSVGIMNKLSVNSLPVPTISYHHIFLYQIQFKLACANNVIDQTGHQI
jgi:hypothetical protein